MPPSPAGHACYHSIGAPTRSKHQMLRALNRDILAQDRSKDFEFFAAQPGARYRRDTDDLELSELEAVHANLQGLTETVSRHHPPGVSC